MKRFLLSISIIFTNLLFSQLPEGLSLSAYLEPYYCYDFGKPQSHDRNYIYSFNRHNELNINLGYIKLTYEKEKVRGNIAMMDGTYANANLATEPGVLKNIYESNIGVKVSKQHNLWLDVGVFAAHIGFEGAVAKDCWTMTRSLCSEYSPFYESGIKLTYLNKSEKVLLSALLLNGWQHIRRPDGNSTPSLGFQFQYKPNDKLTFNYSNFWGNDKPDSAFHLRHFHNFYLIAQFSKKTGITVGFDIGQEQQKSLSSRMNTWYSPVIVVRQSIGSKCFVALRGEYYRDMANVIIDTSPTKIKGFRSFGYSTNFDYHYNKNLLWRIEARTFQSQDPIFLLGGKSSKQSFFLTSSVALAF